MLIAIFPASSVVPALLCHAHAHALMRRYLLYLSSLLCINFSVLHFLHLDLLLLYATQPLRKRTQPHHHLLQSLPYTIHSLSSYLFSILCSLSQVYSNSFLHCYNTFTQIKLNNHYVHSFSYLYFITLQCPNPKKLRRINYKNVFIFRRPSWVEKILHRK